MTESGHCPSHERAWRLIRRDIMPNTQCNLTFPDADEKILLASKPEDGAIEDAEEHADRFVYFFSSGAIGTVRKDSGKVDISRRQAAPAAPKFQRASDAKRMGVVSRRRNGRSSK